MLEPFVAVPSYAAVGPAKPVTDQANRPTTRSAVRSLAGSVARMAEWSADHAPTKHGVLPSARAGLSGLGPLAGFAAGDGVTDLFVNGESGLWVDAGAGPVREPRWERGEAAVRELAVRLIALGGRHIDETSPCVDVRLADGIRVHAVLPPASSTGTLLSIRLPRAERPNLATLAAGGLFGSGEPARLLLDRLRSAVRCRENLLITGAAGSGKTTLLAALLGEAAATERIVAIEDVAELRVDHPHFVALESRQPNLEGAGRIGLDSLLREALRMRPDRLVLGECRGAEIRELLAALNTGHDGGAGTLHANSLEDVPARLEALGAVAGMTAEAVARQAISAIGLILHLERLDGRRRLAQVGRFALDAEGRLRTSPAGGRATGEGATGRRDAGESPTGEGRHGNPPATTPL
jgi:pilus assembly protein CpaF